MPKYIMNVENFKSRFIVLDGIDGCGKSSQSTKLAEYIRNYGVEVSVFRDPGSTEIGEQIRTILLDTKNRLMADRTELLLYMASRAQLWQEKIAPALAQGNCVICDRWLSSTCAYQGFACGIGIERILDIAAHSLERVWPDLTIVLDIDLESAGRRMNRPLDRMEQKAIEYRRKVREGFLKLADIRSDIITVDASSALETVSKNIVKIIENFFC